MADDSTAPVASSDAPAPPSAGSGDAAASDAPAAPPSPALIVGGGVVAVEVTRRLKEAGYDVSAVACAPVADSAAIEAAGATVLTPDSPAAAVAGHKSLIIVDELAQLLTADQTTELATAAKEAGVEIVVRLCTIGTGGGGWFRHRFGEAIILNKHNAAVETFEASGLPFATVNAGVLCQTFASWFGPVVKATSTLPNMLGAARMSFIDVSDVAETVALLVEKRQAGKRLAMNGSRAAQFQQLAAFLTMNAKGTGVSVTAPEATPEEVGAALKEHSGLDETLVAEVLDLLAMAGKGAFDNTSEDAKIALGHREVMLDAFLKENVGLFVDTSAAPAGK